jgi:hypothetical protein
MTSSLNLCQNILLAIRMGIVHEQTFQHVKVTQHLNTRHNATNFMFNTATKS